MTYREKKDPRLKASRSRFFALDHYLMDSPAWQDLSANAQAVYLMLGRRHNGSNNGFIGLSVRAVATRLKIGTGTVSRVFDELQDHGFIACTLKGDFKGKNRLASEWRLTALPTTTPPDIATKDFMRWTGPGSVWKREEHLPPKRLRTVEKRPEIQNTVPPQARMVPPQVPFGISGGTIALKNASHGS